MPDWVAVAHLPSYKVRRLLQRWSVEVPRAIMPNRQRTMHSFYATAGARLGGGSESQPARPSAPASRTAETEDTGHHGTEPGPQRSTLSSAVSGASASPAIGTAVTAPLPSACTEGASGERAHDGDPASGTTNPNPKVRKSGAVGKVVLAQDPGFNGTKSSFF